MNPKDILIETDEIVRRYCQRTSREYYAFIDAINKILEHRGINRTMPMYGVAWALTAKDIIEIYQSS